MAIPNDADKRIEVRPVICYPNETLPDPDLSELNKSKKTQTLIKKIVVEPREGACFSVKSGQFFRIISSKGPRLVISTYGLKTI